jgi:mevalonate pyrophosphate decarboxylase
MKSITVLAPINIALIKYWGKACDWQQDQASMIEKDELNISKNITNDIKASGCMRNKINVPANGSLSVSVNTTNFWTKTRVTLVSEGPSTMILNGQVHPLNQRIHTMLQEVSEPNLLHQFIRIQGIIITKFNHSLCLFQILFINFIIEA